MSQNIEYASICDAVFASSFHNKFPGAFGCNPDENESYAEVDFIAQLELTGLSQYNKWDNHDGVTERKY